MAKIIREKYEEGILVSREVDDSGFNWLEVAKVFIQLVIAVSIAVIAALTVIDRFDAASAIEEMGASGVLYRGSATAPRDLNS